VAKKKREEISPIRDEMTLQQVMVSVNKKFGPQTIVLGSQRKDPPRIPVGIFSIDFSVGGGLPMWGSMCGWGPESGAKSFVGIKAMRSAGLLCWRCFQPKTYCKCSQKSLSMRSMYIAPEGILDREWVQACGVDPNSYMEAICDYGEQYIDVAEESLKADDCGLLIFDSLAALVPETMLEGSASDQFMGTQAAMIGRAVRKLKTRLLMEMKRGKPCTIFFINQMRKRLGVMYGDPETQSGGHAMMHEFSLLLRMVKKSLSKGREGKKGADDQYIDHERTKEQASRHSFSVRKEKVMTLSGVGEFVIVKEDMPGLLLKKGMVDDFNTLMNYAREYEVVVPDAKGWKYLSYKAEDQDKIKNVWRENPNEYLRCEQIIIQRAKERLSGNAK
jgi:recombination protein RecA